MARLRTLLATVLLILGGSLRFERNKWFVESQGRPVTSPPRSRRRRPRCQRPAAHCLKPLYRIYEVQPTKSKYLNVTITGQELGSRRSLPERSTSAPPTAWSVIR